MSEPLDFSDKLKHLTDDERKYVDYCLASGNLPESDLEMIFGIQQLEMMRSNIMLRRLIADMKMEKVTRTGLIKDFKAKEMVKIFPLAIKTLVDTMRHGKEHNALSAAQFVARPITAYLEKTGQNFADIDVTEESDGKYNFTLTVAPLESQSSSKTV